MIFVTGRTAGVTDVMSKGHVSCWRLRAVGRMLLLTDRTLLPITPAASDHTHTSSSTCKCQKGACVWEYCHHFSNKCIQIFITLLYSEGSTSDFPSWLRWNAAGEKSVCSMLVHVPVITLYWYFFCPHPSKCWKLLRWQKNPPPLALKEERACGTVSRSARNLDRTSQNPSRPSVATFILLLHIFVFETVNILTYENIFLNI